MRLYLQTLILNEKRRVVVIVVVSRMTTFRSRYVQHNTSPDGGHRTGWTLSNFRQFTH
jgi:hypothetical protein